MKSTNNPDISIEARKTYGTEVASKSYELTVVEQMAIRDALDERWHNTTKKLSPRSPLAQDIKNATRSLLDKFEQDVFLA